MQFLAIDANNGEKGSSMLAPVQRKVKSMWKAYKAVAEGNAAVSEKNGSSIIALVQRKVRPMWKAYRAVAEENAAVSENNGGFLKGSIYRDWRRLGKKDEFMQEVVNVQTDTATVHVIGKTMAKIDGHVVYGVIEEGGRIVEIGRPLAAEELEERLRGQRHQEDRRSQPGIKIHPAFGGQKRRHDGLGSFGGSAAFLPYEVSGGPSGLSEDQQDLGASSAFEAPSLLMGPPPGLEGQPLLPPAVEQAAQEDRAIAGDRAALQAMVAPPNPEHLLNNSVMFRGAVLVHVLTNVPVSVAYNGFCNLFKKTFMEYTAFEYLYSKLRSGDLDYDYVSPPRRTTITINNLPGTALDMITKHLPPVETFLLRGQNRFLRDYVDNRPIFKSLEAVFEPGNCQFTMSHPWFVHAVVYQDLQVVGGGFVCSVTCGSKRKVVENTCSTEMLLTQLRLHLRHGQFIMNRIVIENGGWDDFEKIEHLLKNLKDKLKTKNLKIVALKPGDEMMILEHIDPGYLEELEIEIKDYQNPMTKEQIDSIVGMTQWEKATTKILKIHGQQGFPIESLMKCPNVKLMLLNKELPMDAIIYITQMVLASSAVKRFEIGTMFQLNPDDIFGRLEFLPPRPNTRIRAFRNAQKQ
ncbi:hypothetical protein GCK72_026200 [Caenorhabditis remanei]|uniref:F-box domain-containing protein n=1 Tax=Caenorhabditis remanei TaxID=31234 RepID=A0A6A5G4S1_CAERE|nr:hypothetical protein GCK72_026200 [Caenorhabditis remanei]KAF1749731.1 hypothetical protein GCK72_026200 [Caenorhabditis remanei]